MPDLERVTVTIPKSLLRDIDRLEKNRSRFVAEAVHREVERRRRQELHKSLQNPHVETGEMSDLGIAEWADRLPVEEVDAMLIPGRGKSVRWIPGQGWLENE